MARKYGKQCVRHTETLNSCSGYTVNSPNGDRTSDHRMQSRNCITEPLVQDAHRGCRINK